jgi:hypothetical protein
MKEEVLDENGGKTIALDNMQLSYPFFSPEIENKPQNKSTARIQRPAKVRMRSPFGGENAAFFNARPPADASLNSRIPINSPAFSQPRSTGDQNGVLPASQGMIFSTCETNVFALSAQELSVHKKQGQHEVRDTQEALSETLPSHTVVSMELTAKALPLDHKVEHIYIPASDTQLDPLKRLDHVRLEEKSSVPEVTLNIDLPVHTKKSELKAISPLPLEKPVPERAYAKRGHGLSRRHDARAKSMISSHDKDDRTAQERLKEFREKHALNTTTPALFHNELTVITPTAPLFMQDTPVPQKSAPQPVAVEPPLDERIVRLELMLSQLLEEAAAKKKVQPTVVEVKNSQPPLSDVQAPSFARVATGLKPKKERTLPPSLPADTLHTSSSEQAMQSLVQETVQETVQKTVQETVLAAEKFEPSEQSAPESSHSLSQHVAPTMLLADTPVQSTGATTLSALLNNRFPNLNFKSTGALPSTPSVEASSLQAVNNPSSRLSMPLFSLTSSAHQAIDVLRHALTFKSFKGLCRKAVKGLGHMVRPHVVGASIVGLALFILMLYLASAPSSARSVAKPQSFDLWVTDVFAPLRRALNAPG